MDHFYSLGLLLGRASVALSKALNTALAAHDIDLPHSQFIVLRCLYYNNGLSQLEIAHLLSKDASAIKRTVDNLEKKGLVVRRQVRTLKNSVHITAKGHELIPKALEVGKKITDEALSGIDERELLRTMLNGIHTNLEKKQS